MIDIKFVKKNFNPLNAVVTGIIALFICIRILSNNHENVFIIETLNPTETSEIFVISKTSVTPETSEINETQRSSHTAESVEQANDHSVATSEPLAYSAELGKTFNLDAFNHLSKEELMSFSGIGEVTAQAILDYRKENGPFREFNDLMLVKGIGEKKLQKIMTILP